MLSAFATLLLALHALGAALGAGAATFAEIFYTKATADGRVDARERAWFSTTYWALSRGMVLVLFSGLALILVRDTLPEAFADSFPPLWMQTLLALFITATASLLSRKRISWEAGSALVFAGWWLLFFLDVWRGFVPSILTLCFLYLLLSVFSYGGWAYARMFARMRALKKVVHKKDTLHHS